MGDPCQLCVFVCAVRRWISPKWGVGYEWATKMSQRHTLVPHIRASTQRPEAEQQSIPLHDHTCVCNVHNRRYNLRSLEPYPDTLSAQGCGGQQRQQQRARSPTRSSHHARDPSLDHFQATLRSRQGHRQDFVDASCSSDSTTPAIRRDQASRSRSRSEHESSN